jgi:tetratricopeptide (TPR) repeat protein
VDTAPRDGFMSKNWMEAAGQSGIPAAFVVGKDGKIAWIGHPMELDGPLAQIVAGTFDSQALAAKLEKEQVLNAQMERVQTLVREGKPAEAVVVLDRVIAGNPNLAGNLAMARFNLLLTFDEARAYAYARKLPAGAGKGNAMLLNSIAWTIVDSKKLKAPDYALALTLSEQADALTKNADWQILDTLAVAQFKSGKKDEAIATETKAIEIAKADKSVPPDALKELTDRLEQFKKAE